MFAWHWLEALSHFLDVDSQTVKEPRDSPETWRAEHMARQSALLFQTTYLVSALAWPQAATRPRSHEAIKGPC